MTPQLYDLQKSSLPSRKDKVEISHSSAYELDHLYSLELFCGSKAFSKYQSPPQEFSQTVFLSLETWLDFSFGGWSERLQQFMPVCEDSLQFNLFNI